MFTLTYVKANIYNAIDYTCNGVSDGGRKFFVGPLPMVEGKVNTRARNDPDPSTTLATKTHCSEIITRYCTRNTWFYQNIQKNRILKMQNACPFVLLEN